jgi:hypothetical protein
MTRKEGGGGHPVPRQWAGGGGHKMRLGYRGLLLVAAAAAAAAAQQRGRRVGVKSQVAVEC